MRRSLKLVLVLASFAGAVQSAAAHSPDAHASFTVHVFNYAQVDAKILAEAERVAVGIFRKAGVETRWVDDGDTLQRQSEHSADQNSPSLSDVWVHILPPAIAERLGLRLPNDVMGFAPGEAPDRQIVYVFYASIEALAQHRMRARMEGSIYPYPSTAQLLGDAMAHEIGHLLLNMEVHSHTGIMRGNWGLEDLSEVAFGRLVFTTQQAEVMRAEVIRRVRQQQAAQVAALECPTLAR